MRPTTTDFNDYAPITNARWIPVKACKPSPFQARADMGDMEELTASVKANDVETPIKVRPLSGKSFEIVYGHRRHEAAKRAGRELIPALIEELSDTDAASAGLRENMDRDDFSDWEEAQGIVNLSKLWAEHGTELSDRALGSKLGRSATYVRNAFEIMGLPKDLEQVAKGGKGFKSSLLLVAKSVPDYDRAPFIEAIEKRTPFRKVEEMVGAYKAIEKNKADSSKPDSHTRKHISKATSRQKEAKAQVAENLSLAESSIRRLAPWLTELSPADYADFAPRLEKLSRAANGLLSK